LAFQGYVPESGIGFIEACEAANIPIVEDLNTGDGVGVKQGTGTLDARLRRSSAYDAFYKPIADRANLDVLHYASVQHLIFDDESETPTVVGVGFVYHPTGIVHEIRASKEVVVSMGAFHSPQLLMVSGVGPSSELQKFGIEPVLINENIGRQ
jgi:choline dehydrogenase